MFHASSHKKELVCDLTITRHICAFFQIVLVLTDFQHLITMASCFCVKVSETQQNNFSAHCLHIIFQGEGDLLLLLSLLVYPKQTLISGKVNLVQIHKYILVCTNILHTHTYTVCFFH